MRLKKHSRKLRPIGLKLKTTLTACLLSNLLTVNATATETILKAGKVAPFNGVLVSDKQYRSYVANEFELKSLRQDVSMLSNQLEGLQKMREDDKHNEPNVYNWLLSGIILGAALGFSAAK